MYRAVFLVLLLCFPGAAFAQNRPLNVDVDRIEDVRLNEEGRRILRFRTNRVGRLRADIFANPDSTGAISVTFRERGNDDTDSDTPPSDVWGAGRYEAVVQAVNPGSAIIQMRVTLDVPLDEYEPNNSLETAARVDLPFRGMVQLNQGGHGLVPR